MRDYLDVVNELDQHLAQASAVINYLSADIGQGDGFCVSNENVSVMLWTAQTLLENAIKTADELHAIRGQERAIAKKADAGEL